MKPGLSFWERTGNALRILRGMATNGSTEIQAQPMRERLGNILKTLHHHTWLVLRPLFDTTVLILLRSARKTSLDKLILRPCCGCCVAISILKPGVKGGRERWCKVLSINRHILGLGHNFGLRANMGYNDCKPVIVASM